MRLAQSFLTRSARRLSEFASFKKESSYGHGVTVLYSLFALRRIAHIYTIELQYRHNIEIHITAEYTKYI